MVFTNNVPQGNQTIASTTDPIRNNFTHLKASIAQEHNFSDITAASTYHLRASMPNHGSVPTITAPVTGVYYVAGAEARFYNGTVCRLTEGTPGTNGFQWLGKVLMQWGFVNANINTSGSVNFPIAFPTECFTIQTTPYHSSAPSGGATVSIFKKNTIPISPTTSSFSWVGNTNSSQYEGFYWMAIGN